MLGVDLRATLESLQPIVRPLINRRMIGAMIKSKDKHMWPVGDAFKTGMRNALTGMWVSVCPPGLEDDESICRFMRHPRSPRGARWDMELTG